jgi:hypothetical protein
MHQRFSDYTTGGAFALTLSRNQVSALGMIAATGDTDAGGAGTLTSLWRKGLIDQPHAGGVDLTAAGARTLDLLALAGLTNSPADTLPQLLEEAQAEAAMLREQNLRLARDNQALACRLRDQMAVIKRLSETDEDGRRPRLVFTGVTDHCPNRTVADMLEDALQIGADLMETSQ